MKSRGVNERRKGCVIGSVEEWEGKWVEGVEPGKGDRRGIVVRRGGKWSWQYGRLNRCVVWA